MELIDLGCAVLRTPVFEWFMAVAGYWGHGSVGSMVGLLLLAYGYGYNSEGTRRAGIAVLIALMVAGLASQILKQIVLWPRPAGPSSLGFPSGRTSAAFALASVLTTFFPALGPLFYTLAVLTAISLVYFRAHFLWSVLGGIVIGLSIGIPAARKLRTRSPLEKNGPLRLAAWGGVAAVAIAGLVFFNSLERSIARYRVITAPALNAAAAVTTFDFGTPQARKSLRYGWAGDERWFDGKQSVVWATGLASELTISLPEVQDYRFRLYVLPYAPMGSACQTVEVKINATPLAKIRLERGWHFYEFDVPKSAIRADNNSLQFFYHYAESPKSRHRSPDQRALSVAFDKLHVFSRRQNVDPGR